MSEFSDNAIVIAGLVIAAFVLIVPLAASFAYQGEKLPKNEFDARRMDDNLEIIELLQSYIEDHPEQRFGQILKNLEVFERQLVKERGMEEWESGNVWIDHKVVHEEPSVILKRMKKALADQ